MKAICKFAFAAILALGANSCGKEDITSEAGDQPDEVTTQPLKVLGIGNSWTRDSYRYICGILKSAGINTVIAHAYLGGSALADQFYGIDDQNYTYSHNSIDQKVHSTYQYWLYDGTDDPVKTPKESLYDNGALGTGVTLEYILNKEEWDVITFQPSSTFVSQLSTYLGTGSSDSTRFSVPGLIRKVKALMPEKVKIGLLVPWSYPSGCTSHYSSMYTWNGGSEPADQDGWNRVFDDYQAGLQDASEKLAAGLGEPCSYYVNVGKAIYLGRQNEILSQCGYKLQREQDNTHLSEGVAKYLASLMFAYEIFGLKPSRISFCPSTYDFTEERVAVAREVAWDAWRSDAQIEVDTVSTSRPVVLDATGALLKGSFRGLRQNSAQDFSCGFEYREEGGAWTVVTVEKPFYDFSSTVTGLDPSKIYTVRAWASAAAGKKYGAEQTLKLGNLNKITLSPTVSDFTSQGLPSYKTYPVSDGDPGQEAFVDKEFIYTHPDTKKTYSFVFYGKGPQLFSSNKYYLYFAYQGDYFLFGKGGSYIKLPAVPDMRLESVTLTCDHSKGKGWGVASGKTQVETYTTISGGEVHQFTTDTYTFTLPDTEVNTSYYLFLTDNPSKMKIDSIVYTE